MAKVIEFYIPKKIRKSAKWIPQAQPGKVIEFSARAKKSNWLSQSGIWGLGGFGTGWSLAFAAVNEERAKVAPPGATSGADSASMHWPWSS